MVTVCPSAFAISFLARPTRLNQEGGLLSNFHVSTLPSSFFASRKTTIWGLIQSTCVSVPATVNLFSMSKTAEGEWCAHRDAAAKSTVNKIKTTGILYLKEVLSFTLGGVYHLVCGIWPRNMRCKLRLPHKCGLEGPRLTRMSAGRIVQLKWEEETYNRSSRQHRSRPDSLRNMIFCNGRWSMKKVLSLRVALVF